MFELLVIYRRLRSRMECLYFFFFKQKTAYEMRISDWSSDVCSSDLDQEDNPQPEQPPRKLAVLLGPRRRRFVLHFNRHAGHGLSLRFHTCLRRTALPWAE